jgi:ABC-type transport system substrate-binding protein
MVKGVIGTLIILHFVITCNKMWWVVLKRKTILPIILLILTAFLAYNPSMNSATNVPNDLNYGPYIDGVLYRVMTDSDQRYLAMQTGEIEMDTSFLDPDHLSTIDADPDITIFGSLRNGYDSIAINCQHYPLNISGLRRAFAFAFNKTRVSEEITHGFSKEHDSIIPYSNSWCIEDQFDYYYYTDQAATGNAILNELGFNIDPTTGYRNAPDGQPFSIDVWYDYLSPEYAGRIAQIGVDALQKLHIYSDAEGVNLDIPYIIRSDYKMLVSPCDFVDFDVDWLGYEYVSEYADSSYLNPTHFANDTYDSWRNQLLYGKTQDEVMNAAAEMQKILQYNVPRLVVCENVYLQAYRTDRFVGHVPDLGRYITGAWTMRKIHRIDGTQGGIVPIAIGKAPTSFNFFLNESTSAYHILQELWSSLYSLSPNLNPYPDLAERLIVEIHANNSFVPDGHMRFTVDIIQNATWSDGTPLTAYDIEFSILYTISVRENGTEVPPSQLVACYAPIPSKVVIEYSTESFWHFSDFAYIRIIPEHIFSPTSGIVDTWETWNPVFNSDDPHVTCGPFVFSSYEQNNSYSILKNSFFHYRLTEFSPPDFVVVTTGTNSSTIDYRFWLGGVSPLSLTISAASLAIIVLSLFEIYKHKKLTTTTNHS